MRVRGRVRFRVRVYTYIYIFIHIKIHTYINLPCDSPSPLVLSGGSGWFIYTLDIEFGAILFGNTIPASPPSIARFFNPVK